MTINGDLQCSAMHGHVYVHVVCVVISFRYTCTCTTYSYCRHSTCTCTWCTCITAETICLFVMLYIAPSYITIYCGIAILNCVYDLYMYMYMYYLKPTINCIDYMYI